MASLPNAPSSASVTVSLIHPSKLRTHLVLGRVSNVPTVWSNCFAGWLLAGGGLFARFVFLCFGATCLYIGGMYLNDAFDTKFDFQHRKERPIPRGIISAGAVWAWGFGWLGVGWVALLCFGGRTAILGCLLVATILVYDAIHKAISVSPIIMALCRVLLYWVAGSVGIYGASGLVIWSGLVLGLYVGGLSYVAKTESTPGAMKYWPCYLLGSPILLAWLADTGPYRARGIFFSIVLLVWVLSAVRHTFGSIRNPGRTVSALLAGIVLVDLLAIASLYPGIVLVFGLFFIGALIFQRSIPAT